MNKCSVLFVLLLCPFLFNSSLKAQGCSCSAGMLQYRSLSALTDPTVGLLEGGYASKLNVYQGETISFYVSTFANPFTLKIYRLGKEKIPVDSLTNLPGGIKETKESDAVWENGCKWKACYENFKIPLNWKAGAYIAEFPYYSDKVTPILFFVKEKDTSKRSRVLVACATNNYQAYNMFGGKSLYDEFVINPPKANKVSFNRPVNKNDHHEVNRGSFDSYEAKLIYWLESFGYGKDVDVVGESDLHFDPEYLYSHDVLLVCGHSEYWSRPQRENIETFVNRGKHFMCLSGNTSWWQVRFEDGDRTLVCYKIFDPNPDPKVNTMEWYRVERENPLLGTSYQNGGQTNYHYSSNNKPILPGCLPYTDGFGGYIVHNAQHWVYKNSGLSEGDTLGFRGDSSIVGYETDAALFKWQYGLPVPTGEDRTPLTFRILGLSPSNHISLNEPEQWATMGIHKLASPGSGFVFNAATIRWVWGLYSKNSQVSIITKNMLDHFLANTFPPEITFWAPFRVKSDSVLKVQMSFNSREIKLQYGKNLWLKVEAKSYYNEPLNYAWAVNDSVIPEAKGKYFLFSSIKYPLKDMKITAFTYNETDTASIDWKITPVVGSGLAITSIPDTIIHVGRPYKYTLSHFSYYGSTQIKYTANYLPKWAAFDTKTNTITGTPTCIKDSICITATDEKGAQDSQNFTLQDDGTVYVSRDNDKTPGEFYLAQNYPNPFNPVTSISYSLPESRKVRLQVYNSLGNNVGCLIDEFQAKGNHTVKFDGASLPSGIYYYRLEAGEFTDTKKLVLLK
ncbi:MAG: N,N-dimethylformamidase beta subunit family domain-containing protein [Clostridiales bacterium]